MNAAIFALVQLFVIVPTILLSPRRTTAGDESKAGPLPLRNPFDSRAAKERQSEWAKHSGRAVIEVNSIGMKLALIPPGEFDMGENESIAQQKAAFPYLEKLMTGARLLVVALDSERPTHRVGSRAPSTSAFQV